MTSSQQVRVGLYTGFPDLDQWFISQLQEQEQSKFEVQLISRTDDNLDDSDLNAIVCMIRNDIERLPSLKARVETALSIGVGVLWCAYNDDGLGDDFLAKGASVLPLVDGKDGIKIFDHILQLSESWAEKPRIHTAEQVKQEINGPPVLWATAPDSHRLVPTEPATGLKIITFSGNRACGSSFLAWNAAALLNAPLIAGFSSPYPNLFGVEVGVIGTRWETAGGVEINLFSTPPSIEDLRSMFADSSYLVIDLGTSCDLSSQDLWVKSTRQVFVSTPDPRWKHQPFLPEAVRVLNRVPKNFPYAAEKIFNCPVDLVVEDLGTEGLLSLWTGRPWIHSQPHDIHNAWRNALGLERVTHNQQIQVAKEEATWNTPSW